MLEWAHGRRGVVGTPSPLGACSWCVLTMTMAGDAKWRCLAGGDNDTFRMMLLSVLRDKDDGGECWLWYVDGQNPCNASA